MLYYFYGLTSYARQLYFEESVPQLEHSRSQSAEWVRTLCETFREHSQNSVMANRGFRQKSSNSL